MSAKEDTSRAVNLRERRQQVAAVSDKAMEHTRTRKRAEMRAEAKKELRTFIIVVILSVAGSLAMFWYMDMLSSGRWEDKLESRVHYLHGETAFREILFPGERNVSEPGFVAFYSQTCPHCKKMRLPYLQSSNKFTDVKFLAVNISEPDNRDFAIGFGIKSIPSVFFLPSGSAADVGKDIKRVKYTGISRLPKLVEFIEEHRESWQTVSDKETSNKN